MTSVSAGTSPTRSDLYRIFLVRRAEQNPVRTSASSFIIASAFRLQPISSSMGSAPIVRIGVGLLAGKKRLFRSVLLLDVNFTLDDRDARALEPRAHRKHGSDDGHVAVDGFDIQVTVLLRSRDDDIPSCELDLHAIPGTGEREFGLRGHLDACSVRQLEHGSGCQSGANRLFALDALTRLHGLNILAGNLEQPTIHHLNRCMDVDGPDPVAHRPGL